MKIASEDSNSVQKTSIQEIESPALKFLRRGLSTSSGNNKFQKEFKLEIKDFNLLDEPETPTITTKISSTELKAPNNNSPFTCFKKKVIKDFQSRNNTSN